MITAHFLPIQVVKVEYEGIRLHFIDLGGSEVMRKLWGKYYKQGDIVLFVIEESETTRYIAARDCLGSPKPSFKQRI